MRGGLATNLVWIGALKFQRCKVENIDPWSPRARCSRGCTRSSGRGSRATHRDQRHDLGLADRLQAAYAQDLGGRQRWCRRGVPRDAQLPVTTPEAGQEGRGLLSPRGSFLLKDSVLLGASLLTAAKSLRAARRRRA